MLPNANDLPSEAAQFTAHISVPLAISGNFGIPVFLVAAGSPIAFLAPVPKAAIHKDSNPLVPECEVWLAKKCLVAPPASDSELPENRDQPKLSRFVPP